MNTINTHREIHHSQILKDRFHLTDRDLMDYVPEPEELDVWSTNDFQDVLAAELSLNVSEFDYGWDDSFSIDHGLVFQD